MTHPAFVAVPVLAMVLFAALPASLPNRGRNNSPTATPRAKDLLSE